MCPQQPPRSGLVSQVGGGNSRLTFGKKIKKAWATAISRGTKNKKHLLSAPLLSQGTHQQLTASCHCNTYATRPTKAACMRASCSLQPPQPEARLVLLLPPPPLIELRSPSGLRSDGRLRRSALGVLLGGCVHRLAAHPGRLVQHQKFLLRRQAAGCRHVPPPRHVQVRLGVGWPIGSSVTKRGSMSTHVVVFFT